MEVLHHDGKIGFGEVFSPETRVEGRKAKVDGIGSGGNRRLQALPVSSWSQEFGFQWQGHTPG